MRPLDDTIAAIATASGAAGLAVVRVSGPQAVAIADAVFRGARTLADAPGNTLHHGWVVERALVPGGAGAASVAPCSGGSRAQVPDGASVGEGREAARRPLGSAILAPPRSSQRAPAPASARFESVAPLLAPPQRPPRRPVATPSERLLDEVVVALFRAPLSYTREDVVEISCHGESMPARRVLEAMLAAGARLARDRMSVV